MQKTHGGKGPQLTHVIAHILYWKGVWKRIQGGYLARVAKKGGMSHMPTNFALSEDQVSAHVCTGYKKYNTLKNDKGLWYWWLADLVAAQAIETKKSKKSIWKKIWASKKPQNNAHQWHMQQEQEDTDRDSTMSGVLHKNNPTECQASKSKADLELMCLAEADHWFTQASHMPFLSPLLVEIFM